MEGDGWKGMEGEWSRQPCQLHIIIVMQPSGVQSDTSALNGQVLCDENMSSPWFFCAVILLRREMLVLIVKLKYKVQHCKRLFEFIRRIS